VADAEDRRLIEAAVTRYGSRVTYAGPLSVSEVPGFLAGLDLFLFPSRYRHEAEPLVVLEAAREGVPTLAYPVGGLPEVLAATGGTCVPADSSFVDAVGQAVGELRAAPPGEVRRRVHGEMKRFRTGQAEALSAVLALLT
jgi:glycosyltransferase involved in cell wall biosynthesis